MKNNSIEFYQALGKLFFAVAAVDNKVLAEEYHALKKILETEWLKVNTSEDLNQILIVFKTLYKKEQYDTEKWFEEFLNFKNNNEKLFTKNIKQLILNTAYTIANSFARKNKSELIMLAKLDLELKKE